MKGKAIGGGAGGGGGKVIQEVNVQDGAVATGTTQIPYDDSIPQNTEGDEKMTLAITPTSAANKLKIEVVVQASSNVAALLAVCLFQDSIANALAVGFSTISLSLHAETVTFSHHMIAGTTNPITFKVRIGTNSGSTVTFNGSGSAARFGGTSASSITITEIEP